MGLRGQLTLLVLGAVALTLTLFSALEVRREQRDHVEEFRVRNQRALMAVADTVAVLVAENEVASLDTLVGQLTADEGSRDLVDLAVVDDDGRVLAHSVPQRFNAVLEDPFTRGAIESDGPTWELVGERLRLSAPAVAGIRWGTVIATYSLDRVSRQSTGALTRFVIVASLLFAVLALGLWVGLDRLVVRPLAVLQSTVRKMGEGALAERVPPLPAPELKELANNINRMASALQHERENLERVVAERTRELSELNARLERLAVTDGLTGVFNHRRFQEVLQGELVRAHRHQRPMGVLMVDVDFFKKVNDAMGHPAGDELLRRMAAVLSEDLRQTDLIARYGGEEFAIILPETTKAEAMQVAERMRSAVEAQLNLGSVLPMRVTVSIGVSSFPEDGDTGEALLLAADQAMYVAKRQGRNRVIGARRAPAA